MLAALSPRLPLPCSPVWPGYRDFLPLHRQSLGAGSLSSLRVALGVAAAPGQAGEGSSHLPPPGRPRIN